MNSDRLAENRDNEADKLDQANLSDYGIAERIKVSLGERDAAWLAQTTGIPSSTISEIMRGRTPKADRLIKIGKALQVDLEWLLTGQTLSQEALRKRSEYSASEQRLIDAYRQLSAREQGAMMSAVRLLAGLVVSDEEIAAGAARGMGQRQWLAKRTGETVQAPAVEYRGEGE